MATYLLKTVIEYNRTPFDKRGFTLIEVMISISLIGLLFLSLFKMQSSTTKLAAGIKFNTIAPILAKQLINQIEQDVIDWSETSGNFGEEHSGMEWTCDISEISFGNMEITTEDTSKKILKFDITIVGLSRTHSYRISTWRLADENANLQ